MDASHGGSPSGRCDVLGRPPEVPGRFSGEVRFCCDDVRYFDVPEALRWAEVLREPGVFAIFDFGGDEPGESSEADGLRASTGVRGISSSSNTAELTLRLRGRSSGMPVPLLALLRAKGESRSMMMDGTGTGLCFGMGIRVPFAFVGGEWKYCLASCSAATSSGVRSSKSKTSSSCCGGDATRWRFMS